jgi:hypothetical protein
MAWQSRTLFSCSRAAFLFIKGTIRSYPKRRANPLLSMKAMAICNFTVRNDLMKNSC